MTKTFILAAVPGVTLCDGCATLCDGRATLCDGRVALCDGRVALCNGHACAVAECGVVALVVLGLIVRCWEGK